MRDLEMQLKIKSAWANWRRRRVFYPNVALWWERCVLRNLKMVVRKELAEQRADQRAMEHHLNECILDILNGEGSHAEKLAGLNRYKAKLVRLHAKKMEWVRLDQNDGDLLRDEQLSLFHLLRQKKRRAQRRVTILKTDRDEEISNDREICDVFADHYARHFDSLHADPDSVDSFVKGIQEEAGERDLSCLDQPITEDELYTAVKKGDLNKAPGIDGVGQAFYKIFWNRIKLDLLDLINFMFQFGVTTRQNHGVIVNLPKVATANTPEEYRPITLLTSEYKILTRIMAARLRPLLHEVLHRTQFCGTGKTILEAVAQVRDAIAYSASAVRPLCVVSLHFRQAFDRISHQFMQAILPAYGLPPLFCERVRALYNTATASVRVNSQVSRTFHVRCGVRQGCPLSMALFGLVLHPLLTAIEKQVPGLFVDGERAIPPVIAYADDVTILSERPEDLPEIRMAIDTYESATGASLNTSKSAFMPMVTWPSQTTFRHIVMRDNVRVLGIRFGTTIANSAQLSWGATVGAVRAVAYQAYQRQLSLDQRILFVRRHLLAKIWYVAQLLPPSATDVGRLETIASWYIWKGAIFRVPRTTLQLPKLAGGWGMEAIGVKCKVLLYGRMQRLAAERDTCTSLLLHFWNLTGQAANPPKKGRVPLSVPHCRHYERDVAYLPRRGSTESYRAFQWRLQRALVALEHNLKPVPPMRIVERSPTVRWEAVWANIHGVKLDGAVVSDWYLAIHDVVPTRQRLAGIRLVPDHSCPVCGEPETLEHRLIACTQGPILWCWTKKVLAAILRARHTEIPDAWAWCPDYAIRPPQRGRAVSWMVASFVRYRLWNQHGQSLHDYRAYLYQARREMYQRSIRKRLVGNYLEVFD
jgi:hypothetical protein